MVLLLDLLAGSPALGAAIVFIVIVALLLQLATQRKTQANLPPGPQSLPFVGNLLHAPKERPYLQFTQWRHQYGDLISLHSALSDPMIVLNSSDLFHKLIINRGAVYSGRPVPYVLRHFVFPNQEHQAIFFQQGDGKLRSMRTAIKTHINSASSLETALPMQERAADHLIAQLLQSSHQLDTKTALGVYTFEIAMMAILGRNVTEATDLASLYKRWTELEHDLLVTGESGFSALYDVLPLLRYLPNGLRPGEKAARAVGEGLGAIYRKLFSQLKSQTAMGKEEFPGMLARCLQESQEDDGVKYTEDQLQTWAQFVVDAATDTTVSVAMSCIMALATNRAVFKRAWEEVDRVCGGEMPTGRDIMRLRYLKACVDETLRWRPPVPLLLPHRVERDDVVDGYTIPKDSMILVNMWAITHNEDVFEGPDEFRPERFLEQDSSETLPSYPFGLGRRMCPGDQFAMQSLMVGLSKLIWRFDIVVEEGRDPDVSIETGYTMGLVVAPKKLPIKFVSRPGRA